MTRLSIEEAAQTLGNAFRGSLVAVAGLSASVVGVLNFVKAANNKQRASLMLLTMRYPEL